MKGKLVALWLSGAFTVARLIPADVTHSGSAVDLVPAAEDEAGLGVVHPAERQGRRAAQNRTVLVTVRTTRTTTSDQLFRSKLGGKAGDV